MLKTNEIENNIRNVLYEVINNAEFYEMHHLDEMSTISRPTDNIPNNTKIMVYAENDVQGTKTPHFHISIDNGNIELELNAITR